MSDTLSPGGSLTAGQSLTSKNGKYVLELQSDGNLVLSEDGKAVWAAGTNGSGTVKVTLQEDGNFVAYNGENKATWASETSGNHGASLIVEDNRNVGVYDGGGAQLWSTKTKVDAPAAAPAAPAPEAAAAPAAPAAPAAQTYTVAEGDTLWAIAERFYGDGNRFQQIADASGIANPDLINPGQVLTIPA